MNNKNRFVLTKRPKSESGPSSSVSASASASAASATASTSTSPSSSSTLRTPAFKPFKETVIIPSPSKNTALEDEAHCALCKRDFKNVESLQQHQRDSKAHNDVNTKREGRKPLTHRKGVFEETECLQCEISFECLADEDASEEDEEEEEERVKKIILHYVYEHEHCVECERDFATPLDVSHHLLASPKHAKQKWKKKELSLDDGPLGRGENGIDHSITHCLICSLHLCSLCHLHFETYQEWVEHRRDTHEYYEDEEVCDDCSEGFYSGGEGYSDYSDGESGNDSDSQNDHGGFSFDCECPHCMLLRLSNLSAQSLNINPNDDVDETVREGGQKDFFCSICLVNEPSRLFLPCRHLTTCKPCTAILLRRADPCPICRSRIEKVERVLF